MRTTVTLDPDVEARIKQVMRERGVSFKDAVNDAVRAGLQPARAQQAIRSAHVFARDSRWN